MKAIHIFLTVVAVVAVVLIANRVVSVWTINTQKKEGFVNKKCPDNTRSDGPCLMEF